MINKVKDALNTIVGSVANLQHAIGAGRAFELYIMTGISLALLDRGYDVWMGAASFQPIPTGASSSVPLHLRASLRRTKAI